MPYKIAIASGKGGTGKTTVAVNLLYYLQQQNQYKVQLLDCDVEEPNDLIFFENAEEIGSVDKYMLVPEVDNQKCTYCKKCVEYCEFNAMSIIPSVKHAEVDKTLCHSCGACLVACAFDAIQEKPKSLGKVSNYKTGEKATLLEGRLEIGSAMQTTLIKQLKKHMDATSDIVLMDAPPGTSCPVVETVSDADFVILVAEPTLFGLHDFKLMVALLKEVEVPFAIIINKAGLGDRKLYDYIQKENIQFMGEIPFNRDYAASYATGDMFSFIPQDIRLAYSNIIESLTSKVMVL